MRSEINFSGTHCTSVVTVVLLILVGVFQVERTHFNNPSVQVLVEKKPSNNAGLTHHHEVRIDYITRVIECVFYHCTYQAGFFNNGLSCWAKNLNASGKQIKKCSYA